jgi:hypothetical protein
MLEVLAAIPVTLVAMPDALVAIPVEFVEILEVFVEMLEVFVLISDSTSVILPAARVPSTVTSELKVVASATVHALVAISVSFSEILK